MNKLKFSHGGQPVFLNDFQLLYENALAVNKVIIESLTGREAMLLEAYETTTEGSSNGEIVTVSAGTLLLNGELYPFEETVLNVPTGQRIYVCPHRNDVDVRVFADGVSRSCQTELSAVLKAAGGNGPSDEDVVFALEALPTFADAAEDYMTRRRVIELGQWSNGFSGSFMWRRPMGTQDYEISVVLHTDDANIGLIGADFPNEWFSRFRGKESPSFPGCNGKRLKLMFGLNGANNVFVTLASEQAPTGLITTEDCHDVMTTFRFSNMADY